MASEELAELYGGPLENRTSIFSHLEEGLQKNRDGPAIIVMHQPPEYLQELVAEPGSHLKENDKPKCLRWSYTQLHSAAMRLVTGLTAHDIQPGMRIVTLIPNRVEYPLTLWMSTILRLTLCSLDPGSVTAPRRDELANLMTMLAPDVVVVLDEDGAQAIDQVYGRLGQDMKAPCVRILLEQNPNNTLTSKWTTISALANDGLNHPINETELLHNARQDSPTRHALILFTSGTSTGKPKGCPRHVASITHILSSRIYGRGQDPSSRVLVSSANFRIINASLSFAVWKAGGACIIPPGGTFTPRGVLDAIEEWRVTYILFIPALLHALVSDPAFDESDVSSVKDVSLGGDMITRDILLKASRAFPSAPINNSHGMTEGGGVFAWPFYDRPLTSIPYIGGISPMGTVAPGARLRILNPSSNQILRRDEMGELCVHSESIIKSYLDFTHAETFFQDPDGKQWFKTGDLALINPQGIIYILGRIKDVIKRSGVPITPAALESCIETFTGSQTSVVAWPHEVLGQEPLVVVKSLNGRTEDEVREQVVKMFGKDYALGPVVTLEQLGLGSFPLNATGKIVKMEVLEAVQACFDREHKTWST